MDGRTLKLFLTLKNEALGPQIMGVQWMTRGTQARSRVTAGKPSRASLLPLQRTLLARGGGGASCVL